MIGNQETISWKDYLSLISQGQRKKDRIATFYK